MSLFAPLIEESSPLPERLRPRQLTEVFGQAVVQDKDSLINHMLTSKRLQSIILWGPPGCGKTTIARLLAEQCGYEHLSLSATDAGVVAIKSMIDKARHLREQGKPCLLFVDEIHRFNRAQQDAFLPALEDGTLVLVGATTENPSFECNAALLSRCHVIPLKRLDDEALEAILSRAEQSLGKALPVEYAARQLLIAMADGDGRYLLSMVEALWQMNPSQPMDAQSLQSRLPRRALHHDKGQESHYNLISVLHKAVRASDVNAALYWLARMLQGGEHAHYIARRLIRMAVEDIGMADPQALLQANAALAAYDMLGTPEGELALAQAVIYLATAPKSNAQYMAYKQAMRDAATHGSLMPPAYSLNAPTKMMKEQGYGAGYAYDHDAPHAFSGANYFPEQLPRQPYYQPKPYGFEREIQKRLEFWERLRHERQQQKEPQS